MKRECFEVTQSAEKRSPSHEPILTVSGSRVDEVCEKEVSSRRHIRTMLQCSPLQWLITEAKLERECFEIMRTLINTNSDCCRRHIRTMLQCSPLQWLITEAKLERECVEIMRTLINTNSDCFRPTGGRVKNVSIGDSLKLSLRCGPRFYRRKARLECSEMETDART